MVTALATHRESYEHHAHDGQHGRLPHHSKRTAVPLA
jgi:hypothetical protein